MGKPEPLVYSPSQEDQFLLSHDTVFPPDTNDVRKKLTDRKAISPAAFLHLAASLCWLLGTIALCLVILLREPTVVAHCPPDDIYPPARPILDYKSMNATFDHAYMGEPDLGLDEAWEKLYKFGTNDLSTDIRHLVRDAQEASGHRGYIVTLNVFHQLHCLNGLRKLGRPEYYKRPSRRNGAGFMDFYEHVDHCVEALRRDIMCQSDLTPRYWFLDEAEDKFVSNGSLVQSCRNFTAVREWAVGHLSQVQSVST